jgi:hypothetical protein
LRRNWSAKVRSLLFEQGENDVSLGQRCSINFSARFRQNRVGLYIGQNHLRDTWQAKKAHAMDKLSRHRRDDDTHAGG